MNEVIKCLLERRSIRAFSDKRIPLDDLKLIAETARMAPSARNQQKWKFTVVRNAELIGELCSVIEKELYRPDYDKYNPDAIIIATAQTDYEFAKEDCACALENIFLAAHSLGIGSVWINQLRGICDREAVRQVLTKLNIPSDHSAFGVAALGYPAQEHRSISKLECIEIIS